MGNKVFYWPTLAVLSVFYVVLTYMSSEVYWSADAAIFANIFRMDESLPPHAVDSVADVWESQCVFYRTWSGRFVCQFAAQVFCGLLPRWVFVCLDGFAWLAFVVLVMRMARIGFSDWRRAAQICMLTFFIFVIMPFDPVFMANYLWTGILNLLWLHLFVSARRYGARALPLLALLGLLAGNGQEAYSIPLSGALCELALMRRFRFSRQQWVLGAAYLVGTVIVVAAPGNYVRMAESAANGLVAELRSAVPSLLVTALVMLSALPALRSGGVARMFRLRDDFTFLLWAAAGWTLVLMALLHFQSLGRLLVPVNIYLMLLVMSGSAGLRPAPWILGLLAVFFAGTVFCESRRNRANHCKYAMIERLYHESADGDVYIPDAMYFHDDGSNAYYPSGWEERERVRCPGKPALRVMPESFRRLRGASDTLAVWQIAPQAWAFAIPKDSEDRVVFEKVLFPGLLDIPLGDRVIDCRGPEDVLLDTVGPCVEGVYFNNRPYMLSRLRRL